MGLRTLDLSGICYIGFAKLQFAYLYSCLDSGCLLLFTLYFVKTQAHSLRSAVVLYLIRCVDCP